MRNNTRGFQFIFIFFFFVGLFLVNPNLFAQVNRDEMENLGPVEFVNYEGPYTRIDTRAQIRDIGYTLGVPIRNGQTRAGTTNRYFVIHSVSPADGLKIDADIFGLGVDVGVDHIRNLRLIIQGYLEGAYNYSERDAALLAEYITIYNAVYRGDLDFFSSRYKNPVMENLTRERVGLSVRFNEWPGQTLIVIPLSSVRAGPLSSVDTSALIDPRVTDQLRDEPDMGLNTRRDMVDLLERQAEQAAAQAETQRETIRQEEQRLTQEGQQIQQQQRQADQLVQQAQQNPERAVELQRQAEEVRTQVEQRQQEMEQGQQLLAVQRQEVEQVEQYAERRADAAQDERRNIAEDQQSRIGQVSPPEPDYVLGTAILVPNTSLGRIVLINPANGQESRRSAISTVNTRSLTLINGRVIAIAGETQGSGAIRLVEFDSKTLEMVKQGNEDISPQSLIWVNGADLYAIIIAGGNSYLARFNSDLELQSRSPIAVHPFAAVTFGNTYIITQRTDGSALLLYPRELTDRQ